jgi:hypothetical protein
MDAAALLRTIESTGIRLHRDGDRLRAEIPPCNDIDPFRARIAALKPVLLRELVHRELVTTAAVEPLHFDRERYDPLQQQWRDLPDLEAATAALVSSLEAGWNWLAAHPDHPEHESFLERWIARLRQYEQVYATNERRIA